MKICNIVPIHYLGLMEGKPVAMFLTHLVEKYPDYAKFARGFTGFKILDNSLIEMGGAVDICRVVNAAEVIGADEIILPDVFKDGGSTISAVDGALDYLEIVRWTKKPQYMAVVQGESDKEFTKCFNALNTYAEIDTLGIPKVCATLADVGRPHFEKLWTRGVYCEKNIHLLGLWYSFEELYRYEEPERIRSVDTCLAAYFAQVYNGVFNPWAVRPDKFTIDLEDTMKNMNLKLYSDYEKFHGNLNSDIMEVESWL